MNHFNLIFSNNNKDNIINKGKGNKKNRKKKQKGNFEGLKRNLLKKGPSAY